MILNCRQPVKQSNFFSNFCVRFYPQIFRIFKHVVAKRTLLLVAMFFCVMGAWGAVCTWTGNPGSEWDNTANWSTNTVPGQYDTAIFTGDTVTTVIIDSDITVQNIETNTTGNNKITIDLNGYNIKTSSDFKIGPSDGNIAIEGIGSFSATQITSSNTNTTISISNNSNIKITGYITTATNGTINIETNGTLDLSEVNINSEKLVLTGTGDVDISNSKITGAIDTSNIAGSVDSSGAETNGGGTTTFPINPSSYTWTGNFSRNWDEKNNWSSNIVPASTDNVVIPSSGITKFPVISTTSNIKSLTIESGATVTLNTGANLTVTEATTIVTGGTLTGSDGSITTNTMEANGTVNLSGVAELTFTGTGASLTPASIPISNNFGNVVIDATATGFDVVNQLNTVSFTSNTSADITISGGKINTTGDQTYGGTVTLDANTTLSAGTGNITFNNSVSGTNDLTFDTVGTVTITGTVVPNTIFSKNAILTSRASGEFTNNVTISGGETTLNSNLPANSITIDSVATLNTGTHNLILIGNLTNAGTFTTTGGITSVASLSGAGTWNLAGTVTSTGNQSYDGTTTLTDNTTLTATGQEITFEGTVTGGNNNLTISDSKKTTFSKEITEINTLTVKATGTETDDYIALEGNVQVTNINFDALKVRFNKAEDTTEKTIDIANWPTNFNGELYINTTYHNTIKFTNTAPQTLNARKIYLRGTITTNEDLTFNAQSALISSVIITADKNLTFADSLDSHGPENRNALTIASANTATFSGAVGTNYPLTGFNITASEIKIDGGSVTTNEKADNSSTTEDETTVGIQIYNGNVNLGANTTLTAKKTSLPGNSITFQGNISGSKTLTLDAESLIFGSARDQTVDVSTELTFAGAVNKMQANTLTFENGFSQTGTGAVSLVGEIIATNGNLSFEGETKLTGNTTLEANTTDGKVVFTNTINGSATLTVTNAFITTLGNTVGSTNNLTDLTITSSTIQLNGDSITTTGKQTYNNDVTMDGNIAFEANTANIVFANTIKGQGSLTVDADAGIALNGDSVTTEGKQTYNNAVSIDGATRLNANEVVFIDTIIGSAELTVNSPIISLSKKVEVDSFNITNIDDTSITVDNDITINKLHSHTEDTKELSFTINNSLVITNYLAGDSSNVTIASGNFVVETFNTTKTGTHIISVEGTSTFSITERLYGDFGNGETLTVKKANGAIVSIPRGGSFNPRDRNAIFFKNSDGTQFDPIAITTSPEVYTATLNSTDKRFPMPITLTSSITDVPKNNLKFPFTIEKSNNDTTYDIENSEENVIPLNTESTKDFNITRTGSYNEGDTVTITIRTPDNSMVLDTLEYTIPKLEWLGTINTNWYDIGNWTGLDNIDDLKDKTITIDKRSTNYQRNPTIGYDATTGANTTTIGSLILKNDVILTINNNGTLNIAGDVSNTAQLSIQDTSSIKAISGTVIFTNRTGHTNVSLIENSTEKSSFDKIIVEEGKTLTISDNSTGINEFDVTDFTIEDNATLSAEKTNITFVDNGASLTTPKTALSATFNDVIIDTGDAFTFAGNIKANSFESKRETSVAGTIETTDKILFNNAITLTAETQLTSTNNNVTFKNDVTGSTSNLTISATNGDIIFEKDITLNAVDFATTDIIFDGSITPERTVTIGSGLDVYTGAITLNTGLAQKTTFTNGLEQNANGGLVRTQGTIVANTNNLTFSAPVGLAANSSFTATTGNINFNNTINEDKNLTLIANGTIAFNSTVGNTAPLTNLIATANIITINGISVTTTENQEYNGTMGRNAIGDINLTAGTTIICNGKIAEKIDNFTAKAITTKITGELISTSENQTYVGNVILDSTTDKTIIESTNEGYIHFKNKLAINEETEINTTLGNITFDGTIDGNYDINIVASSSEIKFNDSVGETSELLNLKAKGDSIVVNGGKILTNGNQTYTGNVTISTLDALLSSSNEGSINWDNDVTLNKNTTITTTGIVTFDKIIEGPSALTITNPSEITFTGTIGAPTPLASLITTATTTNINGTSVTTTRAQIYNGNVVTDNSQSELVLTSTTSGNITFAKNLDGDRTVKMTGKDSIIVSGSIGSTNPLANLSTKAKIISINAGANNQTTKIDGFAAFDASESVTFGNHENDETNIDSISFASTPKINIAGTLATTNSASAITFPSPVTLTKNATVTTKNGAITFNGTVTQSTHTLTVNAGSGATAFNENITGSGDLTINETAGSGTLSFTGGSTSTGALTIRTSGNVTFGNAESDSTSFGSLDWDGTTPTVDLAGTLTTTSNEISFPNDVTLLTTSSVIASNNITFTKDVKNTTSQDFTVTAGSGIVELIGNLGKDVPLKNITVSAKEIWFNNDAFRQETNVSEKATLVTPTDNTGKISLGNHNTDKVNFGSFDITSGTVSLAGLIKTTNGEQIFNCDIILIDNTELSSADGAVGSDIIFNGTINSNVGNNYNLSLYGPNTTTRANNVVFGNEGADTVGVTDELLNLNVYANTIEINSNAIKTTENQIFNGDVKSDINNASLSTSKDISIIGNVTIPKTGSNALNITADKLSFLGSKNGVDEQTIEIPHTFENYTGEFIVNTVTTHFVNGITQSTNSDSVSLQGIIKSPVVHFVKDTTLTDNTKIIITKSNSTVSFDNVIDGTYNFEINADSSSSIITTEFKNSLGSTNPLENILIEDSENIIFHNSVTANNGISLTSSNEQNKGVEFMGDVTADTLTIHDADVYITNTSDFTVPNISKLPKNLYIVAEELDTIIFDSNFDSNLDITNNFVLISGKVTLPTITKTGNDAVFFGKDYEDNYVGTLSGKAHTIEGLFRYIPPTPFTRVTETNAPTLVFPTTSPSAKIVPQEADTTNKFAGSLTDLSGKTITVGKNFYGNGIDLEGNSNWTLYLPENDNAVNSFAESYNLSVKNSQTNADSSTFAWVTATENITNNGGNTGWAFSRPVLLDNDTTKAKNESISGTYTITNDIIRVEFKYADGTPAIIENTNNEIEKALTSIKTNTRGNYTNGFAFTEAFIDAECTISTRGKDDLSVFYLRVSQTDDSQRWNTDATGKLATTAADSQSTDSKGIHQNTIPNIHIPLALDSVYETLRDQYKNRIATINYDKTADRCDPVLIASYTGQELHGDARTTPTNLKTYDAHNFIEFVYSEEIETPGVAQSAINIKATDSFGKNSNTANGIEFAKIARFENGKLEVNDKTNHALYRNFSLNGTLPEVNQTHRLRLSIVGYVDGTITVDGKIHHNWEGNISDSITPSGTVTPLPGISDVSVNKNGVNTSIKYEVNTTRDNLYGLWDTSAPVFAKYSADETSWIANTKEKEITGYSQNTSYIESIEFHFFDNTPEYIPNESFIWQSTDITTTNSKRGWYNGINYIADSWNDYLGGSRFIGEKQTSGGIRAGTLKNIEDSLKIVFSINPINLKTDSASQVVKNKAIFSSKDKDTITIGGADTPYLSVELADSEKNKYRLHQTFTISYDDTTGIVTDLAGNKLKTSTENNSLHFPHIMFSMAPVGSNEIYIQFSAQMESTPDALAKIPLNVEIASLPSNLQIDKTIPARVVADSINGTGFVLTLNKEVTYEDITASSGLATPQSSVKSSFKVIEPESITNVDERGIKRKNSNVYALQQDFPLSIFAINAITPLYAFDNRPMDDVDNGFIGGGIFGDEMTAKVFDGSGTSRSRVLTGEDITLAFDPVDGLEDSAETIKLSVGIEPTPGSQSKEFNALTGKDSRVWIPTQIKAISNIANTNDVKQISGINVDDKEIAIPINSDYNWATGDQFQFLFELENMTVDHDNNAETPSIPMYVLYLKDKTDILSIDLWSLDIADILCQAGGVTILNNVINTNVKEKTRLEIDVQKAGNLTIQVMTIDGNIVKTLHRGRVSDGLHYYHWDGTNTAGNIVARGMYFIRIIGPEIDETRKVMAVRD